MCTLLAVEIEDHSLSWAKHSKNGTFQSVWRQLIFIHSHGVGND
jgi:hypothetical protein